jgi:hypothetical protein
MTILVKFRNTKRHENPFNCAKVTICAQTDGQSNFNESITEMRKRFKK